MRAMFDRIARVYDLHELGHDGRAAPPLARARRRPRRARRRATARSTSPPAPATSRSSWRAASAPGGERGRLATSPRQMLERARAKSRRASRGSGRTRSSCPYADDELRRRDRRLRRAQLLRPRPRARARWRASCGPGGRVVVLEITTPQRAAALDLLLALVRPRRARARPARRRPGRLRVPAELGQALPRPGGARRRRMAAAGLTRRPLDPHRGRDHRHPRRDGAVSSAEEVLALVEAGGAHVPALMARLEERLEELATVARRAARRARGRDDPRPAASGCGRCSSSSPPASAAEPDHDGVLRAAVAVELIHSATLVHDDVLDAAPLRRGRPTVVATAGRAIATATGDLLFSRAFAELARERPAGRDPRALRRVLRRSRAASCSSARTPGTSTSRASATCGAATSRPRGCSRRRAGWARSRAAGTADALGDFGRRIGLAFQLLDDVLDVSGPGRADRQAPRHRPARRHGHAAADPRARARSRARRARPARRCARPEQAEAVCDAIAATGVLEEARDGGAGDGGGGEGGPAGRCPSGQRAALELVADSVADRYA